jgi:hypothetical protein
MAMKRPAAAKKNTLKSKCQEVADAIAELEAPQPVIDMLSSSVQYTVGTFKASRHPLNERLVGMIGEVFATHKESLEKDVAAKDATLAELTPAKSTREESVESAKVALNEKTEALDKAKEEFSNAKKAVKEATAAFSTKVKEQAVGDEDYKKILDEKTGLEDVEKNAFMPLFDGTAESEKKTDLIKTVLETSKTFGFDSSLMEASAKVLEKPKESRSAGFDETCMDQLKQSFTTAVSGLEVKLGEAEPAKQERAAAVQAAEAALEAAKKTEEETRAAEDAAKEAKASATEALKAAKKSLEEYLPNLKDASEALDEAKESLKDFLEGALATYTLMKDLTEETFKEPDPPPSYYETIEGKKCDRAIIDACREAVAGQGDGRVSVEDAQKIFEKVADGGKETAVERWTLRYCMTHFKWTEAAHDWIITECEKITQGGGFENSPTKRAKTGSGYYETIDGMKCDRGIVDACREAVAGQGDGRVSAEDAEKVWAAAADANTVTDTEKWTLRYCLTSFRFTRAGHDYIMERFQA